MTFRIPEGLFPRARSLLFPSLPGFLSDHRILDLPVCSHPPATCCFPDPDLLRCGLRSPDVFEP